MTLRTKTNVKDESESSSMKKGFDLIGIKQIADYLGFSQRTIWSWRREFNDFPVTQDGASCIWYSSQEQMDDFKTRHFDLFMTHKERLNARYENDEKRSSMW